MSAFAAAFQNLNPVFDRELRQRSRSGRSVILLSLLLTALTGILYVAHLAVTQESRNQFNGGQEMVTNTAGAVMFESVLFVELALLLLIIPGISSGAISGERDRQTLIPLQVTLLGRFGIFMGKVGASSSFVLLLIIASAPLLAIPYLLGGISLTRIMLGIVTTLLTGITYATLGVSCSAFFRRTQTATLMSYLIVFLAIFGSLVIWVVINIVRSAQGDFSPAPSWPMLINPFVGVADAAGDFTNDFSSFPGPFSGLKQGFFGDNWDGRIASNQPNWLYSLAVQITFTGAWVVLGLRKLRLPQKEID
ncbi:MAG: ABC transporter permease [Acidimicrobiales bacterium]|nr:ABC transporter permease [Acidimicrobiales bacterium]